MLYFLNTCSILSGITLLMISLYGIHLTYIDYVFLNDPITEYWPIIFIIGVFLTISVGSIINGILNLIRKR